ncbi:ATPase [Anaerosalibacter sp. Marseille-P3206]|uniref:ATPase n=1 Tax=Anaerosalibacter sp. Marseille-P3206 TaxID=1871005 RepID=UPI0009855CD8|nr:ATPase [Anaerosalibacter sp. Marseille-P3206]
MDILQLIEEIEDIIEESSSIPFSGKVMIDKDEILEIIKEIRIKLPDEIKQASWVKDEKQRILAEAQKEADTIVSEARTHLEELIDHDEITKLAQVRAEEIMARSQNNAKEIRIGAVEYADNLLMETQEYLKEQIDILDKNRQELRGMK